MGANVDGFVHAVTQVAHHFDPAMRRDDHQPPTWTLLRHDGPLSTDDLRSSVPERFVEGLRVVTEILIAAWQRRSQELALRQSREEVARLSTHPSGDEHHIAVLPEPMPRESASSCTVEVRSETSRCR